MFSFVFCPPFCSCLLSLPTLLVCVCVTLGYKMNGVRKTHETKSARQWGKSNNRLNCWERDKKTKVPLLYMQYKREEPYKYQALSYPIPSYPTFILVCCINIRIEVQLYKRKREGRNWQRHKSVSGNQVKQMRMYIKHRKKWVGREEEEGN